jgi:hypothetical protein
MWHETPEQRLLYISQQHTDLPTAGADSAGTSKHNHSHAGFTGLRIRLGTLLIVVGRTLCEDEALRHDAAHS